MPMKFLLMDNENIFNGAREKNDANMAENVRK